ncbi:CGNR zinc finger domain-containing protein [Marinomonas sp.]|uniref:CGNR zinc finger domain-containing protein n=1 Tax=Marinomonas sp. TaxID=1904862 RepID=UPI003C722F96
MSSQCINLPYRRQIKRRSNEKCILMFVDTSRTKRRPWCNMESCGNRAKAVGFYQEKTIGMTNRARSKQALTYFLLY